MKVNIEIFLVLFLTEKNLAKLKKKYYYDYLFIYSFILSLFFLKSLTPHFHIVFLKIIENCILAVNCQPFVLNNSENH